MKKVFKKFVTMGIAAVMAVSAMSVSVFAEDDETVTASDKIDYSIYDSDMIYVQEDADMIAEYNANLANGVSAYASAYTKWDWSDYSVYSKTVGSQSSIVIPYYFVPTESALWFNIEITNSSKVPRLTVNILNTDESLNYVGSYPITSVDDSTYEWSNYKKALSKGKKYVFMVVCDSNWGWGSIDISNSSL